MKLVVDIGNSRMKSAIDDDGELTPLKTFAWRESFLDSVLKRVWLEALGNRQPTAIHVSNVAGDALLPNLEAWCCRQWQMRPVPLHSTGEYAGLRNGYAEPATFGVDRWAALIGARATHDGALCVVDSGTATTVDVVDADGQHLGGAILPGIYTMRRSLGRYTEALFAADGEIVPFSDNTASGIAGGTGYASVGAIDRLVREAGRAVGPLTTIVTGGESGILEDMMEAKVVRDPLLVLRGVSVVARATTEEHGLASRCPDVL